MGKIKVEYFDDIAREIKELHTAMQKINRSGLTEEAIFLLVSKSSGENLTTVKRVYHYLSNINRYLK